MIIGHQMTDLGDEAVAPLPMNINVSQRHAPAGVVTNRISVEWRKTVEFLLPVGYEDETGFHYGTKKFS